MDSLENFNRNIRGFKNAQGNGSLDNLW
jgi:hypothetical protein